MRENHERYIRVYTTKRKLHGGLKILVLSSCQCSLVIVFTTQKRYALRLAV